MSHGLSAATELLDPSTRRQVKLSADSVWKVYGPGADMQIRRLAAAGLESGRLREQLRAEKLVVAVGGASFQVHEAEIFVIMGLSGSGKSTLLRCLTRLVEPSVGRVTLDGEDLMQASPSRLIELRRHAMGMVFQNFGLMPHLTALDNVAFPLKMQGVAREVRLRRAAEMLHLVGLGERESALPVQLSGGQQQRVGIARSLAVEPQVWFLDEPFSALDPLIRKQMQDEFLRLQKMLHKTIVFVTHDIQEAFRLADRIAIMRDGEIIQIGTPSEIALSPADEYVAEFTRDLPVLRVITAGDMARPAQDSGPNPSYWVDHATVLEDLLQAFLAGAPAVGVRAADESPCGIVTRDAVKDFIARSNRMVA